MEMFKEVMSLIMFAIITGAGVAIVDKLLRCMNASIDEIQKNTKLAEYKKLNTIIDGVQDMVTTIVQSVNQTFVSDLKKSKKFTKESAVEAKNKALEVAKELITEESANAIEEVYGNVDVYLDNLVESIVAELKK